MPVEYIDAGSLSDRLELLELRETEPGVWSWAQARRLWGRVEQGEKSNLFSSVGVGARDVEIKVRRQSITLHNALRWQGRHVFLTSAVPYGTMHLSVHGALVTPVMCVAEGYTTTVGAGNRPVKQPRPKQTFPGVLTEKYVRYEQEDTYAKARRALLLVTPKAVLLREGDLVTVTEGAAKAVYAVQALHILDEYKNEYEILLSRDV